MPNVPDYNHFTREIGELGLTKDQNDISLQVEYLTKFVNQIQTQAPPPEIFNVSPDNGGPGTEVSIVGKNFQGTTQVAIGEVLLANFQIITSTLIKITTTPQVLAGQVKVRTPAGVAIGPFFVPANQVPNVGTVSVSPASGVIVGAPMVLSVDASDSDGISQVAFYQEVASVLGGGLGLIVLPELLGTATTPTSGNTYSITVYPQKAGNFKVSAVAKDTKGGVKASPYSTYTILEGDGRQQLPPAFNINTTTRLLTLSPATAGDVIEVNINGGGWEVYNQSGTGIPIGSGSRPAGYYQARTAAVQGKRASEVISSPAIAAANITPPTSQAPQNVTLQIAAGPYTVGGNYLLTGTSSSDSLLRAEFIVNNEVVGNTTVQPFTYNYSPATSGQKSLKVRITGTNNQSAESAVRTITVGTLVPPPNQSPVVTALTTTTPTVNAGQTVNLTYASADPDGTVTSIQFTDNDQAIGSVTTASGVFTTPALTAGSHSFKAIPTDNQGLVGAPSSPVAVTANGLVTPPTLNYTLYGQSVGGSNQHPSDGTQFNSSSGALFKYNVKPLGDGTGKVARLSLNGNIVASVDFLAPYIGELLSFQDSNLGTVYYGRFKDFENGDVILTTTVPA